MAYIVYGAVGVLAVLALIVAGFATGWRAHIAWQKHTRQAVLDEVTEEERLRLLDEKRAFDGLLNYNVEQAYGMNRDLSELAKE